MKRILIIALFLMACVLIVANSAWPIPPSPPKAAGAGDGDMTKATYDADENSKIDANKVDDLSATYQVALSLLKGTYTNTYLCKYTSSGTLLDCNVDPAGFQTADATLLALAAQTESQGALQYYTADATPAVLAKGTAYQLLQMNSGATVPEWTSSLSISALNLSSATSSIPWVVGTATAPTAEGQAYWNSSTDTLTIGNGSTATVIGAGAGAGDFKADGTVAMTAALVPNAANTIALGSTSAEWAGIYLGDGAVIAGQNDQSNTITSSATGWSFAKPITIADVSNDNYIKITNNTSRSATVSVNELYPVGNKWIANQNGTAYSIALSNAAAQLYFNTGGTTARTITVPDAAITVARSDAGQTFTGVQAFTAPTVATSITPNTAANASLGTGALPFSSVYIGDAATNNVQLINTAAAGAVTLTLPSTTGELALVKNEKLASFSWDGGASAVATSGSKRCVAIPYAATIVGWTMVISGDPGAGGSILNITKDAYSDSALPTTEIDASAPPTVADNKVAATDATLSGWTKSVTANDIICADVATNAVATWISLTIYGTK